jgi:alpha-glucoside transport system substrate-binding protein
MRRTVRRCALAAVIVLVTACTGATAVTPVDGEDEDVVDVFTPYRQAEGDAFRAVLDEFTAQTGIATRHVGTAAYAAHIRDRVHAGDAPDVALVPQPSIVEELARDNQLVSLDDVVLGEDQRYLPGIDVGTVDGRRVAALFRLEVKSLVWYPPSAFRDAGFDLPTTWQELLELTVRIETGGTSPWCIGMEAFDATGWIGTDWVEDLMLRMHGPETYDAWAAGDLPFTTEPVAASFEQVGRITLTERWVLGGTRAVLATPVQEAILPMLEGPPRCLLTRQGSAQRSFLPEGTTIGLDGDVDVFPLPAIGPESPPLVVSGQLATAFNDDPSTLALMAFLADPAAGEPWAERGGFISPHANFDAAAYADQFDAHVADLVAAADVIRFDASDVMPAPVGTGTFWTGMVEYVSGTPLPTVLSGIDAGYDDVDQQ